MAVVDGRKSLLGVLAVVSLFWGSILQAERVCPSRVQKATETFLQGRTTPGDEGATDSISALGAGPVTGDFREVRCDEGTLLAYVADLEPRGFIALSADTDIAPIIAYSFWTSFPSARDRANPLARLLREDMRLRRKALAEHPELRSPETARQWDLLAAGQADSAGSQSFQQWPPEGTTSTGGWLQTAWHQDAPFNTFCPLDPSDGLRTYVGCVATALAQVIHYHRICDITLSSRDSYVSYSGMKIDAHHGLYDFPSFAQLNGYLNTVRFKYSEDLDLDDTDMAALSFACGVAVQMNYGSDGSGASVYALQRALLGGFGYHSADLFGGLTAEGLVALRENMINGLPALLSFSPPDGWGGHLVVCDGYNTDGEYHLNFGWGSDHPQEITEAWYRLPTAFLYRNAVITESILNIRPTQPVLEVQPASLSFHAVPGEQSTPQILSIRNHAANVLIDGISSPEGFLISRWGQEYGSHMDSFLIEQTQQGASINVNFHPQRAGGYHGVLVIHYSDGSTKNVILSGWAYDGGTSVAAGPVSGTWSRENSPYFVTGSIHVPNGRTLRIEPGVQIFFMGPYGLTIGEGATLTAEGNPAQRIEFTAWNKEAGWGGLRFVNSGHDDVLRYCTISYARKGVGLLSQEAIESGSEADFTGGAIYCVASHPTIDNCKIINNTGGVGGAIYCRRSSPLISNTLIANNTSASGRSRCGGIYSDDAGVPEIRNCTIVNNFPGGIFSSSWDGLYVTNTIVWGNARYQIQTNECSPTVTFSCVQDGYPGEGNIDTPPAFLNPTAGVGAEYEAVGANWGLGSSSPCINAGTHIHDLGPTDLAGRARVYSGVTDIGAFENQSALPLITASPSGSMVAGFVPINTGKTVVIELSNTGKFDFEIVDVSIPRTNAFSVETLVQNHRLAPGESVQVRIRFQPAEERRYGATLVVHSTSSNNAPEMLIDLRGVGITGTPVPAGTVSGAWGKANSPYTITGDIRVGRNQTLTIEPGVVVKFAGWFSLTVGYGATLRAVGTEQDRILFTALDREQGWGGIRFLNSGSDDVLRFCTIEYARKSRRTGGGMVNLWGGAILCMASWDHEPGMPIRTSPTIDSCVIARNRARTGGGIMCVEDSRAVITNNLIVDNYAEMDGAGIAMYHAECTIANNVIARNDALVGGGIMNWMSTPTIRNNTIVANKPSAMHLEPTTMFSWTPKAASIVNNIIWNNTIWLSERASPAEYVIRYNNIQGGWDGIGNINVDPLFADAANGDYRLKSQAGRWDPAAGTWVLDDVTSPCIDAGDPTSNHANEPQPNGGRINLGAYGGTERASKSPSLAENL